MQPQQWDTAAEATHNIALYPGVEFVALLDSTEASGGVSVIICQ